MGTFGGHHLGGDPCPPTPTLKLHSHIIPPPAFQRALCRDLAISAAEWPSCILSVRFSSAAEKPQNTQTCRRNPRNAPSFCHKSIATHMQTPSDPSPLAQASRTAVPFIWYFRRTDPSHMQHVPDCRLVEMGSFAPQTHLSVGFYFLLDWTSFKLPQTQDGPFVAELVLCFFWHLPVWNGQLTNSLFSDQPCQTGQDMPIHRPTGNRFGLVG